MNFCKPSARQGPVTGRLLNDFRNEKGPEALREKEQAASAEQEGPEQGFSNYTKQADHAGIS